MSLTPSEAEKLVRLPVKVVRGQIVLANGKPLPELEECGGATLVVPATQVKDPDLLARLRQIETIEFLSSGASVLLDMRLDSAARREWSKLYQFDVKKKRHPFIHSQANQVLPYYLPEYRLGFACVEAVLIEPLYLALQGANKASLCGGRCRLPTLGLEAISINHAYTLASQHFEPSRKSHTGNVFEKAQCKDRHGMWRSLDHLRKEYEAEYQDHLFG